MRASCRLCLLPCLVYLPFSTVLYCAMQHQMDQLQQRGASAGGAGTAGGVLPLLLHVGGV